MNGKWSIVRLGDYCLKIGSGATPKGGSEVYLESGDVCLIRSQNIYNDAFYDKGLAFITEEAAEKLKNVTVHPDDVLLNITGDSVARVCLAPKRVLPARVNQHVSIIRPISTEIDPRFLRYYLASAKSQEYLLAIAAAGATRNALTKSQIENLAVPKPDIKIQSGIADVLEAIDNKIALNRRINQTLEAMGQALFKSWFIDFEPVRAKIAALETGEDPTLAAMRTISGKTDDDLAHWQTTDPDAYDQLYATASLFPKALVESELGLVPEGWEVGTLEDLSDLNISSWSSKTLPDNIFYVDLANAKDGRIDDVQQFEKDYAPSRARRRLKYGDTIVGTVRPSNRSFAFIGKTNLELTGSTGFAVLSPRKSIYQEIIYLIATSDDNIRRLAHLADGGAYPAVRPELIYKTACLIASDSLHNVFHEFVKLFFARRSSNDLESQTLANLRDTLLPKLLSGELTVAEVIAAEDQLEIMA